MATKLAGELVYKAKMTDTGAFTGDAKRVSSSLEGMTGAAGGASSGLLSLGGAVTAAAGIIAASKITKLVEESVNAYKSLSKQLRNTRFDLEDLGDTQTDVKGLGRELRNLSVGYGAAEGITGVADAYNMLIERGASAEEAMSAIEPALRAAAVGYGKEGLAGNVDYLTRMVQIFNGDYSNTVRILEMGDRAALLGAQSYGDMLMLMERSGSEIQTYNVGMEDTLAVSAALSKEARSGRKMVGEFGAVIRALAAPSADSAAEMKRLGVTWDGLVPTLGALYAKADQADWSKLAPDPMTRQQLMDLVSLYPQIQGNMDSLAASAGDLQAESEIALSSLGTQQQMLKNAFEDAKISLGEAVVRGLGPFLNATGEASSETEVLAEWLTSLEQGVSLVVYALVGFVTLVGGGVVKAMSNWYSAIDGVVHKIKEMKAYMTGDGFGARKEAAAAEEAWKKLVDWQREIAPLAKYGQGFADIWNQPTGSGRLGGVTAAEERRRNQEQSRAAYLDALRRGMGPPGESGGGKGAPAPGSLAEYEKQKREEAARRKEEQFKRDTAAAAAMGMSYEAYQTLQAGPVIAPTGMAAEVETPEYQRENAARRKATEQEIADEKAAREKAMREAMESAERAAAKTFSELITTAIEGGDVGAVLEEKARQGLASGIEAGVTEGLKAAGAGALLPALQAALSTIPIIGPILSAFIGGFMGMEYGGVFRGRKGGYPVLTAERPGKAEAHLPITAEAINEVSRGINLARTAGPGAAQAQAAGSAPAGRPVYILVQGRDELGLDIHEVAAQGAAAYGLKAG